MSDMERNPKIDALLGDTGARDDEDAGEELPPKGRAPGTRDAEVDYEPEDPVGEASPNVDLDNGAGLDRESRRERSVEVKRGQAQEPANQQQRRGDENLEQGSQESDSAFQQRLREAREQAQREAQQWHYWQQQQALQQQNQPQGEQPPDYYEDPAEYLRWQQDQLNQKLQEIDRWRQQQAQASQQATHEDRFRQLVETGEEEVRQQYPDYDEAVEFLKKSRDAELKNWGIRDPSQRKQLVMNEIVQLSNTALQSGLNPAERAYQMARRWGWGNNGRPRPDPGDDVMQYERDFDRELQAAKKTPAKKGQKSHGRGQQSTRSRNRAPSLEELADLDGENFDREWEKLFGGRIT